MKKFLALALALVALLAATQLSAADKPITYAELPRVAQTFVAKYFAGRSPVRVQMDRELRGTTYELRLSDGTELEFDSRGLWTEIDGKRTALPTSFIPQPIVSYIKKQHPSEAIVQIEHRRGGYQLELSSGIELRFDKQLRFVGYDD